jgi:microcin C transport system permease protein
VTWRGKRSRQRAGYRWQGGTLSALPRSNTYDFDKPAYERFDQMMGQPALTLGKALPVQCLAAGEGEDAASTSLGPWTFFISYSIAVPLGTPAVRAGSRLDLVALTVIVLVG